MQKKVYKTVFTFYSCFRFGFSVQFFFFFFIRSFSHSFHNPRDTNTHANTCVMRVVCHATSVVVRVFVDTFTLAETIFKQKHVNNTCPHFVLYIFIWNSKRKKFFFLFSFLFVFWFSCIWHIHKGGRVYIGWCGVAWRSTPNSKWKERKIKSLFPSPVLGKKLFLSVFVWVSECELSHSLPKIHM